MSIYLPRNTSPAAKHTSVLQHYPSTVRINKDRSAKEYLWSPSAGVAVKEAKGAASDLGQ